MKRYVTKREALKPILEEVIKILENFYIPLGSQDSDAHIIVKKAFEKYLAEDISLDSAFGLIASEGNPDSDEKYKQHVVGLIYEALQSDITWEKMPDYLEENHGINRISTKSLNKWYKEKPVKEDPEHRGTRVFIYLLTKRLNEKTPEVTTPSYFRD